MISVDILQYKCDNCGEIAQEPFIECCECPTNLCTSCFSSGREVNDHKNYHKYAIRKNDFPLFENCNWSAKEESKLLQAISIHGYGNWEEIAKCVHTRSKLECQEHYKKYYIDNVQFKELDILPETLQSVFPKPVIPYLFSTEASNEPPRNNKTDQQLAGYNAYRSEFELSYDHNAESIFNIENNYSDDEDGDCLESLKIALFNAFNNRLRERHRRYKIIQNHGLILYNKLNSWLHRYDQTLTSQRTDKLLPFMQFMSGMQFDAFIESLHLEAKLMQKLLRLGEFRRIGIKTLYGGRLYMNLKPRNDLVIKEQKMITSTMHKMFENQACMKEWLTTNKVKRKVIMPLDIMDLPDFHLLSANEKELCSMLRLLPKNYLEIKNMLICENDKLGSLRLLDARRIVKIDVNKTRKIYDYLISQGFIRKPH